MNISFLLTSAGMEICWLSALISVFMIPAWGSSFPVYETVLIFSLAVAVTVISRNRGWLIIQVLIMKLTGIMAALLLIFHRYYYPHESIYRIDLAPVVFAQLKDVGDGLQLTAVILSVLILWYGGLTFAHRSRGYTIVSERFDKGIAVFFILMLVSQGIAAGIGPVLIKWFSLYFIFSMLTIGISRADGEGEREYISGYTKIGLITGFILLAVIIIIIIFVFGLPYLTTAADTGYSILKTISRPFLPLLIRLFRFLVGVRSAPGYNSPPGVENGNFASVKPHESGILSILEKIAGYFLIFIMVVAAVIITGLILRYLFRWLFSKTDRGEDRLSFRTYFLKFYLLLKKILGRLTGKSGYRTIPVYNKLLRWGKLVGLSKISSETPREYSIRLADSFPFLNNEIKTIAELFNGEVYGGAQITDKELNKAKLSWKKIRSFRNWFYIFRKHYPKQL